VEALMGPDRETDLLIYAHQTGKQWRWAEFGGAFGTIDPQAAQVAVQVHPWDGTKHEHKIHFGERDVVIVPAYTASLDAAMSLVPEGWQGDGLKWWEGEASSCDLVATSLEGDRWTRTGVMPRVSACASTPALALTAAALRALAEQEQ
jgi:hypothetical protein